MKNKLNITDEDTLDEAERSIASLRLLELAQHPITGMFGFAHLRKIHRYIFKDIYEWAGEIREGEFLLKGDTLFCIGSRIPEYAENVFTKLKSEKYLRGQDKSGFAEKCAYYMAEINVLHPFREGNGRTSREFFRELALKAGYTLRWQLANPDELLQADIAAFDRNYAPLTAILHGIANITKKQPRVAWR
ncbi:MAG: Fic family protein [Oscillospiraceae bacterium]|nr:Fic family protein [Oscillospiraceae bacterium]